MAVSFALILAATKLQALDGLFVNLEILTAH